jgi:hypothetical protein
MVVRGGCTALFAGATVLYVVSTTCTRSGTVCFIHCANQPQQDPSWGSSVNQGSAVRSVAVVRLVHLTVHVTARRSSVPWTQATERREDREGRGSYHWIQSTLELRKSKSEVRDVIPSSLPPPPFPRSPELDAGHVFAHSLGLRTRENTIPFVSPQIIGARRVSKGMRWENMRKGGKGKKLSTLSILSFVPLDRRKSSSRVATGGEGREGERMGSLAR